MKRDVKPGFQKPENNELKAVEPAKGRGQASIGRAETDGWALAVLLTERWLARNERVDSLLEQLTPGLPTRERARAQQLFFGVVRWFSRLEIALDGLMTHAPRTKLRAILLVAAFELREGGTDNSAQIVHYAVERSKLLASASEARLVNAVARKMAARLGEKPTSLAAEFAHPDWLVGRWMGLFGADATRSLLEWNQTPAPVYARWRTEAPVPDFLTETRWPGFYGIKPGHWEDVRQLANSGTLYLQDPSTRVGVELLAPKPYETLLDACAAPGGKSLQIADVMAAQLARESAAGSTAGAMAVAGRVIALDEEGPRLERLKANLNLAPASVEVALMPADLLKVGSKFFKNCNLPETFDGVLLDAPCSNTGVMRHRVDVKWRLQVGDFARHAVQQLALLRAAARLVRPAGRLVYSTCSLDPAENEEVVRQFTQAESAWTLERQVQAFPWIDGHDGAGAFLLANRRR